MKFAAGLPDPAPHRAPAQSPQGPSGWPAWWMRRSLPAVALLPIAGVFGLLAAARRLAYRRGWLPRWRASVPVIVVDNVTVGGTGKTPLVLAIARSLCAAGWTPGIVSRGHGRSRHAPDPLEVMPDGAPRRTGDEPLLLARLSGCPVYVGRNRARAAQALLQAHTEVDIVLSDDGLQHLGLARDVELVVVDTRGAGNGWLLPAGPLRESWNRPRAATLGPTDVLPRVCSKAPQFAIGRHFGMVRNLKSGEQLSSNAFIQRCAGLDIVAAAGIGNPEQFFAMLRHTGVPLTHTLALPDHHHYARDPFAAMPAAAILMTEKDALKCDASVIALERLWAVGLEVDIDPAFFPWLQAQLPARTERPHGLTSA